MKSYRGSGGGGVASGSWTPRGRGRSELDTNRRGVYGIVQEGEEMPVANVVEDYEEKMRKIGGK